MLKNTVLLLILLTCFKANAQKILIGKEETKRQLKWTDFAGSVENNSPFDATTYWGMTYKIANVKEIDGELIISGFEVIVNFDSSKSWIKKEKSTSVLLKHEQGHFDIGILCMKEIIKKKAESSFNRKNFNESLQNIFTSINKKYNEMGIKYDEETNHSKNEKAQQKWDSFFKEQLAL